MSEKEYSTEPEILDSVKVLTYNIFLRPPLVRNTTGFGVYDHKDHRLELFKEKYLDQYDIICFQEFFAYASGRRSQFFSWAKDNGFPYSAAMPVPSIFSGRLVDGACAILSRYPIVEVDDIVYADGVQSDSLAAKGVLYAKIKVGANLRGGDDKQSEDDTAYIHLFNTHTQASYIANDDNTENEEARNNQVKELAEFVKEKTGHTNPEQIQDTFPQDAIVVCGDFNINSIEGTPENQTETVEYLEMMNALQLPPYKVVDLAYQRFDGHPVTFGAKDENGKDKETVLTNPSELGIEHSLDYILHYTANVEEDIQREGTYVYPNIESVAVENMFVEDELVTQLSDHYGISCVFNLAKMPDAPEKSKEESPPEENVGKLE